MRSFQVSEKDIHAVVSGVDMTITNLQDGKILNSQVRMFEINLFITMFRLWVIDSNGYPLRPPSEIRQRPVGLAEERRRNGIIRAEPLFHSYNNYRSIKIIYPFDIYGMYDLVKK